MKQFNFGKSGERVRTVGLVGVGLVAGVALSLQFPAVAQKAAGAPLPLDELRQLADVYGLIKSDYVEPVEDKKLLSEAITGMVASLDPHSVYLDKKAYTRNAREHAGALRRPRHRSVDGRRLRQDRLADRGFAGLPRRHQAGRPDHPHRRHADQGPDAGRSDQENARRAGQQGAR